MTHKFTFLALLALPNLISSHGGYYYFNGKYYHNSNYQKQQQELASKKDQYCSSENFYKLLSINPEDLHHINPDDDFDSFFAGSASTLSEQKNEKLVKENNKILKRAWKNIALKMHPDKNKEDEFAENKFTEIQLAYDTLKEPKSRTEYDKIYENFCSLDKYVKARVGFDVANREKLKANTKPENLKNQTKNTPLFLF